MKNLLDYLQIKEAAEYLGVTSATLRNWEKRGKLSTFRHPINRYRLYKKEDLDALLQQIQKSKCKLNQWGELYELHKL